MALTLPSSALPRHLERDPIFAKKRLREGEGRGFTNRGPKGSRDAGGSSGRNKIPLLRIPPEILKDLQANKIRSLCAGRTRLSSPAG